MTKIRKAVFPAAGLGTRFLPATKAQPKEMLPLVDKPIIQYVIEEAVAAGLTNIIIVTGRGKNAIEDHFDVSYELERLLQERGKTDLLDQVRAVSSMINVSYVRQGEALGLGHAVLVARDLVGDEPFAVMLGDDIIDSQTPCMKQMVEVFARHGGPVIAVHQVPKGMVVWRLLPIARRGALVRAVLVTMGAGIVAGYILGQRAAELFPGTGAAHLNAFVGGSLLHVVVHHWHLHREDAADHHEGHGE